MSSSDWHPLGGNQYIAPPKASSGNFLPPSTYENNSLVSYYYPNEKENRGGAVLAATVAGGFSVIVAIIGLIGIVIAHWLNSQPENSEKCNEANRRFDSAMGLKTPAQRRDGLKNYTDKFRGCNSGNDQDIDRALADITESQQTATPPQINIYGGTNNFYGVNQPSLASYASQPKPSDPSPNETQESLEIVLPERRQTYSLTPKRYYTTTYQVMSGSVVVDAGPQQMKFKCSSGDQFRLFWKVKPEFILSTQDTDARIQILDIQQGSHLSANSCIRL